MVVLYVWYKVLLSKSLEYHWTKLYLSFNPSFLFYLCAIFKLNFSFLSHFNLTPSITLSQFNLTLYYAVPFLALSYITPSIYKSFFNHNPIFKTEFKFWLIFLFILALFLILPSLFLLFSFRFWSRRCPSVFDPVVVLPFLIPLSCL